MTQHKGQSANNFMYLHYSKARAEAVRKLEKNYLIMKRLEELNDGENNIFFSGFSNEVREQLELYCDELNSSIQYYTSQMNRVADH